MTLRNFYFTLILLFVSSACFCQTSAPDTIYKTDRSWIAAIIDEVSTDELLYFLPEDTTRKKVKIARAKVWKVVYANGESDLFNEPEAIAVSKNRLFRKNKESSRASEADSVRTEPVAAAAPAAPSQTVPPAAVVEPAGARPTEIIIKVQHEPAPQISENERARKYKNYVGIRFGGSINSFYSEKVVFPKKPFYNWEAGLGFSLANSKHYNARLELVYANKGARETFSDQFTEVTSRTKMTYGQANLLPVIIKAGGRKLNPAIGFGGYYAYRINHVSEIKESDGDYEPDDYTQELINNKFDYGVCAMLAFYSGHKPLLEFRYEHGLGEVMKGMNVKNNGLSASLFLSF